MPTGHSRSVVFVCISVSSISIFVSILITVFSSFSFHYFYPCFVTAMQCSRIKRLFVNVKSSTSERCFSGFRNLLTFAHGLIVQRCFSSDNSAFYYPDLLFDHASVISKLSCS